MSNYVLKSFILAFFIAVSAVANARDWYSQNDCMVYLDPQGISEEKQFVEENQLPEKILAMLKTSGLMNAEKPEVAFQNYEYLVDFLGSLTRDHMYLAEELKEPFGELLLSRSRVYLDSIGTRYKVVKSRYGYGGPSAIEFTYIEDREGLNLANTIMQKRELDATVTYDPAYLIQYNASGIFDSSMARLYIGHRDILRFSFGNHTLLHELVHAATHADERQGRMPLMGGYSETSGKLPTGYWHRDAHYENFQSQDEAHAYLVTIKRMLKDYAKEIATSVDPDSRRLWNLERTFKTALVVTSRNVKIAEAHISQWDSVDYSVEFRDGLLWMKLLGWAGDHRIKTYLPIRPLNKGETAPWAAAMKEIMGPKEYGNGSFKFSFDGERILGTYKSVTDYTVITTMRASEREKKHFIETKDNGLHALVKMHILNSKYLSRYQKAFAEFENLKVAVARKEKAAVEAARSRVYLMLLEK